MTTVDMLWLLANFFAPALGVGLIAPLLAKLLWRRQLAAVRWVPLMGLAIATSVVVLVVGLVVFDHDGKMATYFAMTAATAVVMAWFGFGRRRR